MLVRRKKNGAAAGVAQRECGLFGGQRGVERDGHGAEQQAGKVGDGPLGAVLAEDRDAVARPNSPAVKGVGRARDALAELASADRPPLSRLRDKA